MCYQDCAYERKGVFEDWQSGKTYTGFWGTGSTCRQAEVDEPIKGNPDENPVYEGVCNVIGDLIICPDTEVTPPDPQPDPNPPYCFELNGQRECYEPGMTCGYVNDKWACVPDAPEATPNCTYVNGAEICINPNDKKPIPEGSPDHPANGGNGDGDNTNDPQDPRPPSDPNQPTPDKGQGSDDPATNKQIGELIKTNKAGFNSLADQLNFQHNFFKEFTSVDTGAITSKGDQVNAAIDGVYGQVTEEVKKSAASSLYDPGSMPDCEFSPSGDLVCINNSGLMKKLDKMFPEGQSCQVIPVDFAIPGWPDVGFSVSMDFCPLTRAKPILFWFFNALTLFYLFYAFTSISTGSSKKAYAT